MTRPSDAVTFEDLRKILEGARGLVRQQQHSTEVGSMLAALHSLIADPVDARRIEPNGARDTFSRPGVWEDLESLKVDFHRATGNAGRLTIGLALAQHHDDALEYRKLREQHVIFLREAGISVRRLAFSGDHDPNRKLVELWREQIAAAKRGLAALRIKID